MDNNRKEILMKQLEKTAKNLEKNNMQAFIATDCENAVEIAKSLINKGDFIATGGSMSLAESGILALITNGDYNFIDRMALPQEEATVKTVTANAFFCSSNAVTESGYLYNVDGNCNRISAISYGPKSVILVVGYNKIVSDINEAEKRVKSVATPANVKRLGIPSYCNETGECLSLKDKTREICDGCNSETRICCNFLISGRQRVKDRIKVILVPEILGY